ncbi:Rha family transcriptional regulator [Leucobacter aridicollis]|uniref:Phage regulator Rha-like protein n=1 Tax=Leucobacter aridicollis TaxID=283878 RepID=A0A852R6F1_9MICO|nr:Rha family transcriptional regulator [Leucobacter aridicollis]MBL3682610.1 hypothetical protein [Leucobacter aridicollis]NYD26029.1 phage regulator Rha-like protein [Leucobacter aridicollis]
MTSTSIIETRGGELTISSEIIAERTERDHPSILRTIAEHEEAFAEFGLVRFEIRPRVAGQHGGGEVRFAILNEHQATLMMTFMRNSKIVKAFKVELVKQFYKMRQALTAPAVAAHKAPEVLDLKGQAAILRTLRSSLQPDYADAKARVLLARAMGDEAEIDPARRPLDVQSYLESREIPTSVLRSRRGQFGTLVAKEYRAEFGESPKKVERFVNGVPKQVNGYTEEHRYLFDRAFPKDKVLAEYVDGDPEQLSLGGF